MSWHRSRRRPAVNPPSIAAEELARITGFGFDRRIAEVDVDTLDYPPTDALPVGVAGGERHGGVRNRQQPRQPIRPSPP